jgi:hypothetical protein
MAGVSADSLITGVADDATQDNGAPDRSWARHTDREAAALIAVKTRSPTLARARLIRS